MSMRSKWSAVAAMAIFSVCASGRWLPAAEPAVKSAVLKPTPLIARTPEGERQVVLAEIDSLGLKDVTIRLTGRDWTGPVETHIGEVAEGKQFFRLRVPVAVKDGPVRGTLESSAGNLELPEVQLTVPRRWSVYLVQHTHTDIGYTRAQTEILREHLRYIDYALDFCDLTDSYPDDAKFRWTCEISWAVREYLKRRPPEQVERFKRRVAEGRIEVTGMFLNMSEIADENSLAASLQPLREMQAVFGRSIRSAMQDDVNGAAWCLPDYYSGVGVRYLIMGINKTRSILPFERPTPFWWESPSGKRLLAFRADHYMTGNSWNVHEGRVEATEPGLAEYLTNLAATRYPFDRIGVQFSGYMTDNSPPARKECDLVKSWNEAYAWPKLRIATAGEFLDYVEKHHASELPVHRQAWPDWWTDGFGSAARETAASRETHAEMQINEGLLAMAAALRAKSNDGWSGRAAAIQEALLFYDEHTFGAAESISDPAAENSMVQWGEKSSYAWEAVKSSALLREEAMGLLQSLIPRAGVPTLAVFNTLGRTRSGLVQTFIDHEILPLDRRFRIVDGETNEEVPAQRLGGRAEGSYWGIWTRNVPPLGFRTYRIEVSREAPLEAPDSPRPSDLLENAFYRMEISPQTGAVRSLKDRETGRELVDASAPWQLGQFIYERMDDREEFNRPSFQSKSPFRRTTLRKVQLVETTDGPVWKSLKIKAEADGCTEPGGVQLEIRLFHTDKRIEFHYNIRKAPVRAPESVYVSFPFNAPGARIYYEAQGGTVLPGEGQLPGSASDWQTVQSYVAVRDASGQIILSCTQVPLVQLGDFNLGKWQPVTRVEKPHVYSWVMNNYWFTNFRAEQEGEFRWVYSLTSGKDTSNAYAAHFGHESYIPLVARVLTPGASLAARPALSVLQISAPNLALISARPAHDGDGIILHLREIEGRQAVAEFPAGAAAIEVSVLEEPLREAGSAARFSPFETKFVKLSGLKPGS
jgi:Glycosyl hydrolases family 38 N-terminal domain/Glycosyl hydrolases family 38 C-terminal domain